MPHFFLVLSVNGSASNSLGGGGNSGKFGNFADDFARLSKRPAASAGSMPKGAGRERCRLKNAHTLPLSVLVPRVAR